MIVRLNGTLIEKQAPVLVIDVNGVGYEVQAPMPTCEALGEVGCSVKLYIHQVIREDANLLFGFSDAQQQQLFQQLLKTSGVGPKLGLIILSSMAPAEFIHSIQANESERLVRLPGIGKKTASRLILEMQDRLKALPTSGGSATLKNPELSGINTAQDDAISALEALGYKQAEAARMVKSVGEEGLSREQLIRTALRERILQ